MKSIVTKTTKASSKKAATNQPLPKKAPAKTVPTRKAPARKQANKNLAPQGPEPEVLVQEIDTLELEWERDLIALETFGESLVAQGVLDPSANRRELTEYAERCGVMIERTETLIERHEALIKAVKNNPYASNLAFDTDCHKSVIAPLRKVAGLLRTAERAAREILAENKP